MAALEPLALSRDLLEETDFDDFAGLDGVGVLSSAGAEVGAARSVLTEAADCRGDIATEAWGREGSIALLRCQRSVGESGRLFRGVKASSSARDVVLLSRDET